ncbi:cupin domain-containing protein, partial [Rhizobium ruizarguesonis]
MSASNPKTMTVKRPGSAIRSPEGVATSPFWV